MSEKSKTQSNDALVTDKDVITINLQPFLMPISILLSTIILSTTLLIGLNNINSSLKNLTINGGTTATTTTSSTSSTSSTTVTADQIKAIFNGNYIKFGDANRKVLFVEFSDPSCPYCHVAGGHDPEVAAQIGDQFKYTSQGGSYVPPVPEIKKLVDSGQASFAYVYLNGHGHGDRAMEALYCAFDQGKFWEANDLIMTNNGYNLLNNTVQNDKTKDPQLLDFLKGVVDVNQLKSCMDSGKYDNRLTDEINLAKNTYGVQGTPGFFVNTTSFPGAYSFTDMQSAVDSALKS